MAFIFNGRDISIRFLEDPENRAVKGYRVEWQCAGQVPVVHYIDVASIAYTDENDFAVYRDVLTYAENLSHGLTRTPTVTMFAQDADNNWSSGIAVPLQNPIPVFTFAPIVTSTFDGVQIQVVQPEDHDLEGYVAWVGTTTDFPLDSAHERYRGKATSFSIPLADRSQYYVRIAPFDAFGLDLNSTWSALSAVRIVNDLDIDLYPVFERIDAVAEVGVKNITTNVKASRAFRDEALLAVNTLRTDVLADGENYAEAILNLNTRVDNAAAALSLEQTTRTNEDLAISNSIETLATQVDDNAAAIIVERDARTTQNEAITSTTTEMQSQIANVNAALVSEANTRAEHDVAETNARNVQISSLNSSLSAQITSEAGTRAAQDGINATRIEQVSARAENAHSRITAEQQASVDRDNANASTINTVQSNLTGTINTLAAVQQTVTTTSNRMGVVEAGYGLTVQSGNTIAGMKVLAGGGTSKMIFQADAIGFRNPSTGGAEDLMEFVGGQLRVKSAAIGYANIQGANINNLTIGTNHIVANAITVTHFAATPYEFYGAGYYQNVLSYSLYAPNECDLIAFISASQGFPSGDRQWESRLYIDGHELTGGGGQKTADTFSLSGMMHVGAGYHTASVSWFGASSVRLASMKMIILEARR